MPIAFQQFMQGSNFCDFDDPLLQEVLPAAVKATVLMAFTGDTDIKLLTLSWGDSGIPPCGSGSFLFEEDATTLVPASVILADDYSVTSAQANQLREMAYGLDEGIKYHGIKKPD